MRHWRGKDFDFTFDWIFANKAYFWGEGLIAGWSIFNRQYENSNISKLLQVVANNVQV